MKIGHKHYILIIFSIITFIVASVGYYILYKNITSQSNSTSKAFSELAYQKEIKDNEEKLSELYNNSQNDREKIANLIVSEDKVVNFIESVEKIGNVSGSDVSISNISNGDDSQSGGRMMKASVSAFGSWSSIMRTIVELENMPYAVSLNNLRLSTADGEIKVTGKSSGTGKWTLNVEIKVLSSK